MSLPVGCFHHLVRVSNGDYGEVMPRVIGVIMTGLGLVVGGIIATRTEALSTLQQ